jgi:hypothetical protein
VVEQRFRKAWVVGSNPTIGSKNNKLPGLGRSGFVFVRKYDKLKENHFELRNVFQTILFLVFGRDEAKISRHTYKVMSAEQIFAKSQPKPKHKELKVIS